MFRPWLLLAAAVLFAPSPASAETKRCTNITSVPYPITASGVYCLTQDLASSIIAGRAITISSNNVTLDCNGHTIGGTSYQRGTEAFGVMAFDRSNITVRNCRLLDFQNGIWLRGTGITVEDNVLVQSTSQGIYVYGDGSVVRRNRVLDTGGTTSTETGAAAGIRTYGDVDVLDNTVAGVHATSGSGGSATGVYADVNANGVIGENRIRNVHADGAGAAVGIRIAGTVRASLHGNRLSNPVTDAIGLQCPTAPTAIASDNHVNGFATGMQDCSDGGNNVLE